MDVAQSTTAEVPARDGHHALNIGDYVQILLATVFVALFLKSCVIEAYHIPSPSMENTLHAGDFLFANKFIYGSRSPVSFPLTQIKIPRFRFPEFSQPQRGDVIVFELPEYANGPAGVSFVKRCVGLPGDVIQIADGNVRVNDEPFALPERARHARQQILPPGLNGARIFPQSSIFNEDNFGPLRVPKRGDVVAVNKDNFSLLKNIIAHEGHTARLASDGRVSIDGSAQSSYVVGQNYYFMLGDNRDNSLDSRFWGFVPDDLILGKAMFVYFSSEDNSGNILSRLAAIRWNRLGMIIR